MINYENIKKNYLKYLKYNKKVYAVLKANAYGHGLLNIYRLLKELGCNNYCLIDVNDCILLRKQNKDINILFIDIIDNYDLLVENEITISINNLNILNKLLYYNKKIKIQINLNLGFNRFGINLKDFNYVLNKIQNSKLILTGIYTHIPVTSKDGRYKKIRNQFLNMVKNFKNIDLHYASSQGLFDDDISNSIRIGIGLYDYYPSLYVYSKIIKIFNLKRFKSFGYDYKYRSIFNKRIAILNLGYYNGLKRKNKGRYVYINKKKYKIVGNICMNHAFIKIDKKIKLNDIVEVLGDNITLDYLAKYLKTTRHEVLLDFLKK